MSLEDHYVRGSLQCCHSVVRVSTFFNLFFNVKKEKINNFVFGCQFETIFFAYFLESTNGAGNSLIHCRRHCNEIVPMIYGHHWIDLENIFEMKEKNCLKRTSKHNYHLYYF